MATRGDTVSDLQSIASGAYLDIRPSSSEEWVIHNIYHDDMVELSFYDGTNEIVFDADTSFGAWTWYEFHLTYTRRIRVKNTASAARLVGYDGMCTKP